MVDGDGYVGIGRNTYKRKSGVLTETIRPTLELCGSKYNCEQFLEFVKLVVPDTETQICKHSLADIYRVSLSGVVAVPVIYELYGDCTVALERKLKLADQVCRLCEDQIHYNDSIHRQNVDRGLWLR
jgi:hypothetical protein